MKFFRLKKNETLHSFGEAIGEVPIIGKRLLDLQNYYIESLGGTVIDIAESEKITESSYFLFEENLFFTREFLKACVSAAKEKKAIQFCLKNNSFNERFCLPHIRDAGGIHKLGFYYKVQNETCTEFCIDQVVFENILTIPDQIVKGRLYHMDQCEIFASHIISPFHLLFINLAMNLKRSIPIRSKFNPNSFIKLGINLNKWRYRALKRMNKIGRNCDIHPTAIIEGSVLGDNVKIGANTIVKLSVLGSNTYVSENVSVINSVLGNRTYVANSNYINSCLSYDEVFMIHGPYQLSVFGENAACFAVINCDIRLDQETIKIHTSLGIIDSKQPLLGIAYGHRSKTGGGNIIAAGRIVPNDLHIAPPENIILSFDPK